MPINPSWLKGRKIAALELNPAPNGRGGVAYDPVFVLDNGAEVSFLVQETDTGEYGVEPGYRKKPR